MLALKTSPSQYFEELRPAKIEDVFRSNEPALAVIRRASGPTVARAVVAYLLTETLEFFNAKEQMSDRQVALTVDFIIEEYPYMQTDDLALCFRNAMKGKYGKLYNRIDGQIIMGWLRDYNRERCAAADQQSYNEHRAHLSEASRPTDGLFYADYRAQLEQRARAGDKEAARRLEASDAIIEMLARRKIDRKREELERFYEKERERRENACT